MLHVQVKICRKPCFFQIKPEHCIDLKFTRKEELLQMDSEDSDNGDSQTIIKGIVGYLFYISEAMAMSRRSSKHYSLRL